MASKLPIFRFWGWGRARKFQNPPKSPKTAKIPIFRSWSGGAAENSLKASASQYPAWGRFWVLE